MLERFEIDRRPYGFVESPHGYIVSDPDFCYQIRSLRENIELASDYSFEKPQEFKVLTVEEIRALAHPITSYREWAHQWGINGRVGRNYKGLIEQMQLMGIDTSRMPQWGQEPTAAEVTQ